MLNAKNESLSVTQKADLNKKGVHIIIKAGIERIEDADNVYDILRMEHDFVGFGHYYLTGMKIEERVANVKDSVVIRQKTIMSIFGTKSLLGTKRWPHIWSYFGEMV